MAEREPEQPDQAGWEDPMNSPHERRSVITGIGVIAPNGSHTEAFWKATKEGITHRLLVPALQTRGASLAWARRQLALGLARSKDAERFREALRPLGSLAYLVFTLGIVGTGMLAVPTLAGAAAYAVAEAAGWRSGLRSRVPAA